MKQQSSADKFHRRRVAMEKANKAKKDKFFEHDLRLDTTSLDEGGGSKDDDDGVDQVPGVTPDSSTNPEEAAAAALDVQPDIQSPTSSESSTDRATVKSMVHVSKTPKSKSFSFKKQQQTSRKKLLKKLRRLQQLQSLHPGIQLPPGLVPPGFRQQPAPTLRYGPSGKQCCCQCACTTLNNNHLKFLPRQQQHHHQPFLQQQHQYQQPDEPEVLQSAVEPTANLHRQFYQRHNQPNHHHHHHHPAVVQHPQFPARRPARGGGAGAGAGPFCMKEMHSVVR